MNRRYTRADYLNLIKRIKNLIPYVAITTDVLVGFPGESEINFQNTIDLIKEMLPLKVHIFPYSRREGTFAYNFKDEINPLIIKRRTLKLKNVALSCALNYKKQILNKYMDVLIESHSKVNLDFWEGYTDNYIKVIADSHQDLRNQLILLKIKKIAKDYVFADFC